MAKNGVNPGKSLKNAKHEQFCQEYLVDLNRTQAAIRAGFSEKTASSQASRLLTKVNIENRIQALFNARVERTEISADEILRECRRIALADVGEAFNKDGSLKSIHNIPVDIRRAISSFEVVEEFIGIGEDKEWSGYLKKVKFWSKDKNIEALFKHLGLFERDNKQSGVNEETLTLLGLIDGSSKGKLPDSEEAKDAGK